MGRRPKPSIVLKVKNKKKRRSSKSSQVDTLKLLQALSLSMEPATVKDHPHDERAALKSSLDDKVRKLLEDMELAVERNSVRRRWIALRSLADAMRQTDVSKPCCGDGGRQEIKDTSNTSRKQSISDDILSDGEDVDSETLSSPPDHDRWSEWCLDVDSDSTEDDEDICERFDLEEEEKWCNVDALMERMRADYGSMLDEEFDHM
ncbi:hypothetical protein LINGRAHAP2_LOCUS22175 [Linum grandiflorum]